MALPADLHFRLSVFGEFKASHTLERHPIPHVHLWKVAVELRAPHPLPGDRVLDLVLLQSTLDSILSPLQNAHLNNSPHFGMSPTSENVCVWLWVRWQKELPGSPLQRISIALCDLEGRAMGQASLGR
jgi:6-pyruvoyl-tetrahydropterin synthase